MSIAQTTHRKTRISQNLRKKSYAAHAPAKQATSRFRLRQIAIDALSGALAGLLATAPMSGLILVWHRQFPRQEQYPLPPKQIVTTVARRAGWSEQLTEPLRNVIAIVAHFLYGAVTGMIFGAIARRLPPRRPALGPSVGIGFGLLVWTVSYFVLLPALNILNPPTEHPPRRNALMIAAHIVWGGVLGFLSPRLQRRLENS